METSDNRSRLRITKRPREKRRPDPQTRDRSGISLFIFDCGQTGSVNQIFRRWLKFGQTDPVVHLNMNNAAQRHRQLVQHHKQTCKRIFPFHPVSPPCRRMDPSYPAQAKLGKLFLATRSFRNAPFRPPRRLAGTPNARRFVSESAGVVNKGSRVHPIPIDRGGPHL